MKYLHNSIHNLQKYNLQKNYNYLKKRKAIIITVLKLPNSMIY